MRRRIYRSSDTTRQVLRGRPVYLFHVADYEYYRTLSGNEKLQLLLELIMPENPDAAIIERSARVHPLTEHKEC